MPARPSHAEISRILTDFLQTSERLAADLRAIEHTDENIRFVRHLLQTSHSMALLARGRLDA